MQTFTIFPAGLIPKNSKQCVVRGSAVAGLTEQGWRIVALGTERGIIKSCNCTFDCNCSNRRYGGSGYSNNASCEPPPVEYGDVAAYVMVLDEDAAIADMAKQIQCMKEAQSAEYNRRTAAEAEAKKSAEALAEAKLAHDRLQNINSSNCAEVNTLNGKVRKLEVDIGLIRTAIGEREMKKILEATTPAGTAAK